MYLYVIYNVTFVWRTTRILHRHHPASLKRNISSKYDTCEFLLVENNNHGHYRLFVKLINSLLQ